MAPPGRPTPQPPREDEGPRWHDTPLEEYPNPEANPYVLGHTTYGPTLLPAVQAQAVRRDWSARFGREAPLHVEIGSGNGFFLAELARRNPAWNVLGVEIRYKRVVLCARKIAKLGLSNALITRYHGAYLDDLLTHGSVAGMYVNHPDPWPKTRHVKNRLLSRWFLEDCVRFLKPGGWLRVKSDFRDNVDRIEGLIGSDGAGNPLPRLPLTVQGRCDDVTQHPAPWPDDIETNYQSKFRRKGEPVYAIELVRDAPDSPSV